MAVVQGIPAAPWAPELREILDHIPSFGAVRPGRVVVGHQDIVVGRRDIEVDHQCIAVVSHKPAGVGPGMGQEVVHLVGRTEVGLGGRRMAVHNQGG